MGRAHKKTWREEFVKLCRISAKLRVLSAYFLPGTGATFTEFLRCELDSMRDSFVAASPSEWLLLYGSENTNRDPQQAWLAFSLQPDFQLRLIDTVPPFCPRMIARGFP
jgi:hypothetical protein